jgi:hypothetical protein
MRSLGLCFDEFEGVGVYYTPLSVHMEILSPIS